ncbi:hypothetical protein HOY80DRAFT_1003027 [Tuber brumale]|nr:hypothetical protein HOY80DRAFT_1003027 [Tuber brumale]
MTGAFQRLQDSLNEVKIAAAHNVNEVATMNEKIMEMWLNKVSVEQNANRLTTDSGTSVRAVAHWLEVVDQSAGHHWPSLLEDQIESDRIHQGTEIRFSSPRPSSFE